MPESAAFYEETLYPLQSGILTTLAACSAPFYLTGGTALHRHHFADRYSDDLDLFVNRDSRFPEHVEAVLGCLRSSRHYHHAETTVSADDYVRVVVGVADAELKLDLVNDTAPRFGELVSGTLYPRIDSVRNILSNKITALSRLEGKDFADLWTISRNTAFHWSDILREAGMKDAGVAPEVPSQLLRSFPPRLFDSVRWRRCPDRDRFLAELRQMSQDLIEVGPNSLAPTNAGSRAD